MLYNKEQVMWRLKIQRLQHSLLLWQRLRLSALAEAQAEYLSALTAGTEILYLRALLERLGIAQKTQWGEVIG